MQPAPSEPCEHCSRLLIHPVVTTCPRGRTAALRAIDGVRSLGREVAAELASADAAHLVAFKREADAKAKAKGRKRAGRHLPATPGCNFAEADRSPAQVHRKRETGVMPVCPGSVSEGAFAGHGAAGRCKSSRALRRARFAASSPTVFLSGDRCTSRSYRSEVHSQARMRKCCFSC